MRLTRNDAVLAGCLAVVIGMVGASYAAVPLYYMFCRATGYGGTPNRADAAPGATGNRVLTDRADDNLTEITLSYTFYPATNQKTEGKTASVPAKGPRG